MSDFLFACNVLMPIVLVILVGYILKRVKLFDNGFFKTANKLCFRVCLPILLFKNVYDIKSLSNINWKFILYIVLAILALFIIGFIIVKLFVPNDKQKGVLLQAFFRSNYALVGIPLASNIASQIAGADSAIINGNAAIASAFSIPLFNILAVISLSIFDKQTEIIIDSNGEEVEVKKRIDVKSILLKIVKNPLIQGVVSGIVVVAIRMLLVKFDINWSVKVKIPFIYSTIDNLSKIATPLALIALGGQFEFSAVSKLKYQLTLGLVFRIVVVPVLGLFIAYALGFRVNEFPALIGIFATPVAVSSVPMAAEMGQDDELAGQLVVWTTLLSTFSLLIVLLVCRSIGMF